MSIEEIIDKEFKKKSFDSFADKAHHLKQVYCSLSNKEKRIFEDKVINMIKSDKYINNLYGLRLSTEISLKEALPLVIEKLDDEDSSIKSFSIIAVGKLGNEKQHYKLLKKYITSCYENYALIAMSNLNYEKTNLIINKKLNNVARKERYDYDFENLLSSIFAQRIEKKGINGFLKEQKHLKKTFMADNCENMRYKKKPYLMNAIKNAFELAEELKNKKFIYISNSKTNQIKINKFLTSLLYS